MTTKDDSKPTRELAFRFSYQRQRATDCDVCLTWRFAMLPPHDDGGEAVEPASLITYRRVHSGEEAVVFAGPSLVHRVFNALASLLVLDPDCLLPAGVAQFGHLLVHHAAPDMGPEDGPLFLAALRVVAWATQFAGDALTAAPVVAVNVTRRDMMHLSVDGARVEHLRSAFGACPRCEHALHLGVCLHCHWSPSFQAAGEA